MQIAEIGNADRGDGNVPKAERGGRERCFGRLCCRAGSFRLEILEISDLRTGKMEGISHGAEEEEEGGASERGAAAADWINGLVDWWIDGEELADWSVGVVE